MKIFMTWLPNSAISTGVNVTKVKFVNASRALTSGSSRDTGQRGRLVNPVAFID